MVLLKKIFFLTFLLFSFLPRAAIGIEFRNPLKYEKIEDIIDALIDFIFYLAIVLAPLMWLIAAFFFITSAGEMRRVETAKRIALYTLIGLAIVLFAKGIVAVLRNILGIET